MLEENGEDSSAMPPQGVDPQDDSRSRRLSEDQGQKQVQAGVNPRSSGNQQVRRRTAGSRNRRSSRGRRHSRGTHLCFLRKGLDGLSYVTLG